jgi:glycosyltransferase involved in cell wall biosynthesis
MVTSFSPDEYVSEVVEASRKLPHVSFFITGPEKKIPSELRKETPGHVQFTGYISGHTYYEFLHTMDLIVVLTDRTESALLGAYESISAETPLIVSDTETMRHYVPQGAVFVENEAESIRKGIEAALAEGGRLKTEVSRLKQRKLEQQQDTFRMIAAAVSQSP